MQKVSHKDLVAQLNAEGVFQCKRAICLEEVIVVEIFLDRRAASLA